ncbi:MAG: hypothetical protein AB7T06_34770 [Kofleriaceae bacterium]
MSDFVLPRVGQQPTFRPTKESLGDGHIVNGAFCDGKEGTSGCFLEPDQRKRLIDRYTQRVLAAEMKWAQAMTRAQVANLVKKDPDFPIIASFVLEALVGQLFTGAKLGMKLLRAKAPAYIRNFELLPTADPSAAADAVAKVDENGLVSQAVRASKKATTGAIEDALTDESEERQAKGNYLKLLEQEAERAWQRQREEPLGWADDASLIALYHSFDVEAGHTTENYAKALADIVARYEASPASRIGTTLHDTRRDEADDGEPKFHRFEERSLRVVQEVTDGESVRFMYYKADRGELPHLGPEGRKVARKKWNDDKDRWEDDKPDLSKFSPWKPIEPDMLTAAIHNNQREWSVAFDVKEVQSYASYMRPRTARTATAPDNAPTAAPDTSRDLVQVASSSALPGTQASKPTKSVVTDSNPLAPPPTFMDMY